jgi:hypothetical protein
LSQETEAQTTTSETTDLNPASSQSDTSITDQKPGVDLAADEGASAEAEDTRTDEEKAADEAKQAEHDALFGAPAEDAEYQIEGLPEGMEIDKDALAAVTPAFRELGLSDKGASKVAAVYAEKVLPQVMENATKAIETQVIAQRTAWESESEAAIKANGAELKNKAGEALAFDAKPKEAVMQTAAKALDRLAPVGFRDFLKDTGLSQHPAMVAFAYQAGKLLAEDTDLEPIDRGSGQKTSVQKFYG